MAYDVVVIGAGPGGYVCAIKAAELGLSTALIERRPTLGGTCVNIGCIPSKALLYASEMFAEAGHSFAALGIDVGTPKLNLAQMMAHKTQSIGQNTKGLDFLMKKNKIDVIRGAAKLMGSALRSPKPTARSRRSRPRTSSSPPVRTSPAFPASRSTSTRRWW